MVGHELAAVRYFGLATEYEEPLLWLEESGCHSIDFGLDLATRSGEVFGIIWSGRFWQYGVDVLPASLTFEVKKSNSADLTENMSWSHLIGQKIAEAKVHWNWSGYINEPKVWYPQDIELVFSNGFSVFLCASELRENGSLSFQQDNIAVVFGEISAKRYGVGACRGG